MISANATGTTAPHARQATLQKAFPLGANAFFLVFPIGLSKRSTSAAKSVSEVIAEMTIPFISTIPMSNPMRKDINSSAQSPAIVVRALAETGLTTDRIAVCMALPRSVVCSRTRRYACNRTML